MSARVIAITADELDALRGAGPLAVSLYLHLRASMDFASASVGIVCPISLHGLAMATESHIPRGKGIQIAQPTEKEVRLALDRLTRAGLLQRLDTRDRLAFVLPLALNVSARPEQTGRSVGTPLSTEPGTPNTAPALAFSQISAHTGQAVQPPETGKPGTYRGIGELQTPPQRAVDNLQPVAGPNSEAGLGEMIREQKETVGLRGPQHFTGGGSNGSSREPLPDAPPTLAEVGIDTTPPVIGLDAIEAPPEQIAQAVAKAQRIRARERSTQPIGPGLIRRLLAAPAAHEAPTRYGGKLPDELLVQIGTERGIPPRPGESWDQYRRRLEARAH